MTSDRISMLEWKVKITEKFKIERFSNNDVIDRFQLFNLPIDITNKEWDLIAIRSIINIRSFGCVITLLI